MKFKIVRDVSPTAISRVLPPAYRRLYEAVPRAQHAATVVHFGGPQKQVVTSTFAQRALEKLGPSQGLLVIAAGPDFTREAHALPWPDGVDIAVASEGKGACLTSA